MLRDGLGVEGVCLIHRVSQGEVPEEEPPLCFLLLRVGVEQDLIVQIESGLLEEAVGACHLAVGAMGWSVQAVAEEEGCFVKI